MGEEEDGGDAQVPPIDSHHVLSREPGRRHPHNASFYVEVDQRAPYVVLHVVLRVKAMRMCSTIAADGDAEHGGAINIA